ncbi:hypothetical protein SAY86_004703 [Trapa natans]|uniref:Lipid desaturase domain-containing protein n=1 Tax=Trapa natans TaxID=22666 RepID=A0AAN7RP21_TRANT|nr:hypothetical protein SAY86_004703 [Trapa natans]
MSVLPQRGLLFSASASATGPKPTAPWRVRCLAVTTTRAPPASRPKPLSEAATTTSMPSTAPSFLDDPSSLKSTWSHRAWVACGCTTVFASLAKSALLAAESHSLPGPVLAGWVGYILADLGSGVYHWGIDNYGDASTPVVGAQIEAFQGHHRWPWTITRREFANNLHALARAVAFLVLPVDLLCDDAKVLGFVALFSGCIMFSQQFHAWAHGTKSRLPGAVVALQEAGILVSRAQHAAHHRTPYNNNYCIVSGAWNAFLDENKVFEALEMALFFRFGLRPRSWDEPSSEWTEDLIATASTRVDT